MQNDTLQMTVPRSPWLPGSYFTFPAIAKQNPWLDLLRAIAVLLVLFRHGERNVTLTNLDEFIAHPLHTLFINGWVGVDLFLVLSGYLIGKSLIKMLKRDNAIDIRAYFRGRALRIIPAFYAILFFTAAGLFPLFEVSGDNLPVRLIYHMLFMQDYLPSDINVVFWSLGVEEKFYILAPLIFFCLLKAKKTRTTILILLTLFLFSPIVKLLQYMSLDASLDYNAFFQNFRSPFHSSLEPLVVGVAISYAEISKLFDMKAASAKLLFCMSSLLLGVFLSSHIFMQNFTLWDMTLQPIMIAILFGCLVVSANALHAVPVFFETFWRILSRLSYSLYLVHFPLIPVTLAITLSYSLPPIAFWLLFFAVSFIAALVLHFMVEKPFLILKDKKLALKHG